MAICKNCREHVTPGRPPFQRADQFYAFGTAGAFCPEAEGRPHVASVQRSYTVGLPVMITVEDDGTVTIDVDLSEAASSLEEDEGAVEQHGETALVSDRAVVETAIQHPRTITHRIN